MSVRRTRFLARCRLSEILKFSDDRLHAFTITIREDTTEQEFLKHIKKEIPSWIFWGSAAVLFISLLGLVSIQFWRWEIRGYDAFYPFAFLDFVGIYVGLSALALLNMAVARCPCVMKRVSFHILELYCIFVILFLMTFVVVSHPPFMAAMRGYPPRPFEDTSPLLVISSLAMGANMAPFLRWHRLIPANVWSVAVYVIVRALALGFHPSDGEARYATQLLGLVALASYGKRRNQLHERLNFLTLIEERTSRAASEFQLEQVAGRAHVQLAEERTSTADESLPTTTDTGRAFRITGGGEIAGSRLAPLREVGLREEWLIESKDLACSPSGILGVGGFGIAIRGSYQGTPVALKLPKASVQNRPSSGQSGTHIAELCNELHILRRLRHPNVVVFYGAWVDEEQEDLALVLELIDGVSLRLFVREESPLDDQRALVLAQISRALVYLHAHRPQIIHGDLKNSNIFVEAWKDRSPVAKLLDFGLARRLTKRAPHLGGSVLWVAPEVVQARTPSAASDVFSFGRVMYYVATGNTPGEGQRRERLINDLRSGVVAELAWPAADRFPNEYRNIVERCNEVSSVLRPNSMQVHDAAAQIAEKYGGPEMFPPFGRTLESLRSGLREIRRAARQWRTPGARPLGHSGVMERDEGSRRAPTLGAATPIPSNTRLYPGYEVTPVGTLFDIVVPSLLKFNFETTCEDCCHFHAAVRNVLNMLSTLTTQNCVSLGVQALAQCSACGGIITTEEVSTNQSVGAYECAICGELVDLGHPQQPEEGSTRADPAF